MQHPPFLSSVTQLSEALFAGAFKHTYKLAKGQSYVIYAPARKQVTTLFFFLTGNPGLLPIYKPFLETLSASSPNLAVIGHAPLGHGIEVPTPPKSALTLDAQIDANVELLDSLLAWVDKDTKIVLCGHSVGAWMMCEVAKRRPERVDALFFITPALCNIANTPNGRWQYYLFSPVGQAILPICARILRPIAAYLAPRVIPPTVQERTDPAHYEVVKEQAAAFMSNPRILTSALILAWDEMYQVAELDREWLRLNREKIFCFFAKKDNWVGDSRAEVEEALGLHESDGQKRAGVIAGEPGIPHAFALEHNVHIAEMCIGWLRESVWRPAGQAPMGPEEIESEVTPRGFADEATL
ncbi:alpha/beta-hydrolase [Calocera cornea HHB12733]|uniref:Alpha/beta-hydrolase n=1 Tax=Calocera cornea HHB12733 TaxID=1353952 RepID=A0A165JWE0_9BASI|nr:alpha/beta-hydrolase [Calocera cornea HHB12733]